jgi:metallo-beta-lactamase class B
MRRLHTLPILLAAAAVLGLSAARLLAAPPTAEELAKDPALFLESARKALRWDEPAEPARLVGPIYFVGTKGLSVFLIATSEGHIIVNTGMPGSGKLIEASIRKLGFKPEEIKILLIGHAHVDHAGGHAHLQKLSGAKVAVIAEEQELIESGGKKDFFYGKQPAFEFDPVKVDQTFKDGDEIKLGDVTLKALLTGGHTKGSTTFAMKAVEDGKTYSVVFPNGTSVNPGYRVEKNPSYPGIGDDYRRTLRILEGIEPDIWLHPHNDTYAFEAKLKRAEREGAKAWVDPEGYKKWVALQRTRFEEAVAREKREADGPKP